MELSIVYTKGPNIPILQAFSFDAGDCPRPRHCPRRMIYEGSWSPSQKRVLPPREKTLKNFIILVSKLIWFIDIDFTQRKKQ